MGSLFLFEINLSSFPFIFSTQVLLSFSQPVQRGLKVDVNEFCNTHTGPLNTIGVTGA